MQQLPDLSKQSTPCAGNLWRVFVALGLLLLCITLSATSPFTVQHVFAAPQNRLAANANHEFIYSPSQGPVGTVIAVSGTNLSYPDQTQISLGYSNFSKCFVVADSQGGTVTNQTFNGWLRWPSSTGIGHLGVCVVINNVNSFLLGGFDVLAATPPQLTVTPTTPNAGKQLIISGTSFLPGGVTAALVWRSASTGQTIALGTATSDNNGTFTQAFTVPTNTSTGMYSISATSGTMQPPTLNALTSFYVAGVTIAPVSTPGSQQVTPPAVATVVGATPVAHSTPIPATTHATATSGSKISLLLPLIAGGLLLIIAALIGGIMLVRRQRKLDALAAAYAQTTLRSPYLSSTNDAFNNYLSGKIAVPEPLKSGDHFHPTTAKAAPEIAPIPFDADLAEAMRQAQVSLFVMPGPSVGEKALP